MKKSQLLVFKDECYDIQNPLVPEELLIHRDHSLVVAHLFQPLLSALVCGGAGGGVVRQDGVSFQTNLEDKTVGQFVALIYAATFHLLVDHVVVLLQATPGLRLDPSFEEARLDEQCTLRRTILTARRALLPTPKPFS